MFGPARTNAIQVRKFQNNRRCSLSIENEPRTISGFVHPVVVSPSAKLRIISRRVRAQKVPGESRYGENRGKNAFELCFLGCARVVPLGDPRTEVKKSAI